MPKRLRRGLRAAVTVVVVALAVGAAQLVVPVFIADPPSVASIPVSWLIPASSSADSSPSATPSPTGALQAVGLGDSVMSGTNCGCDGIMDEYAEAMAKKTDRQVDARNFGYGGAATWDLLSDLWSNDSQRDAVGRADVVVVIIGANDLEPIQDEWRSGCPASCYEPYVQAMGQRLDRLLGLIQSLAGSDKPKLLVTNYWNVFTDGTVARQDGGTAELQFNDAVTAAANQEIAQVVAAHSATLVDLVAPFKGSGDQDPSDLLADDGDHPNAAGVKAIVNALVAAS